MDIEYVRITTKSNAGEEQPRFAARLSEFWTHMLRNHADDFEKVYAETIEFEKQGDVVSRQYLCEESVIELVVNEMTHAGIDHEPIDWDDRWNKYEAVASEWWQIEH